MLRQSKSVKLMEWLHYQLKVSALTTYPNLASSVVNKRLLLGGFVPSKSESWCLSVGLALKFFWQNQVPQLSRIHIPMSCCNMGNTPFFVLAHLLQLQDLCVVWNHLKRKGRKQSNSFPLS